MKIALYNSFTYSCNDGYCKSDTTPAGDHIRWTLRLLDTGKRPTFNYRADMEKWCNDNGYALAEEPCR